MGKLREITRMQHALMQECVERNGHKSLVIWLTGLPAAGKTTLGQALRDRLFDQGIYAHLLDADAVREGLNADLGFSEEDRSENVRRIGHLARELANAGVVTIVACIAPDRRERHSLREMIGRDRFIEVFVDAPSAVCAERDPKGLYARHRAGELKGLTGVDAMYEVPIDADVWVRTHLDDIHACSGRILDAVREHLIL